MAAFDPPKGIASFGGFDRWIHVVGGVLQHAGLDGFFPDPDQAYVDPDVEQWLPFLQAVGEVTYWEEFTVSELSKTAQDVQWNGSRNEPSKNAEQLRNHLPAELVKSVDTPKFTADLGYAFRRKRNAYYGSDNIHIAHTGKETRDGAVLWEVRLGNQSRGASSAEEATSSSSSSSAPPRVGDIRNFKGQPYRFDGQGWSKQ